MRVLTPKGVMLAMRGLEANTSEFMQQGDAIRSELLDAQRRDPVGVGRGSCTWVTMLSLLQLDIICRQKEIA